MGEGVEHGEGVALAAVLGGDHDADGAAVVEGVVAVEVETADEGGLTPGPGSLTPGPSPRGEGGWEQRSEGVGEGGGGGAFGDIDAHGGGVGGAEEGECEECEEC